MKRVRGFDTPSSRRLPVQLACLGILTCLAQTLFGAQQSQETPRIGSLPALQARLKDQLSRTNFAAAAWGVKVISLETGKTLFEHAAGKLLKPASNAKLYTAALALDRLGPDYRIRTSLYAPARPEADGTLRGNLTVFGRGDPSFAARFNDGDYSKSLEPLVNAIAAAGVKRIEGDLIGDESYFRGPPYGSSWNWDDLQYYYGAEVSALTVEDNVIDLVFKAGTKIGDPCQIIASPATTFVTFLNRTKTSPKDGPRKIELYRPLAENTVRVTGQLPLGGTNFTDAVSVHKPAAWFVALLREALLRRGITVSGNLKTVDWLERETNRLDFSQLVELGTAESRPLREILGKMLKPSQNLYAQLLLLQVGAWRESSLSTETAKRRNGDTARNPDSRTRRPAGSSSESAVMEQTTEELGLAEMQQFLKEAGIKKGEVLLEEGSGLSRGCLLTPNATVALLRFMAQHRHAGVYRDALPVAGVDGSLRNRLKQTKAAGNARAKTGSLRYVDALSGYVTTASGEPLAFSIMLNNFANSPPSGRESIDALVVTLANFQGRSAKDPE